MTVPANTEQSDFYTPGVCNLNAPEAAYRRNVGLVMVIVSLVVFISLLVLRAPFYFGLIMLLPTWLAAISFLQARENFCVTYAAAGKYNASEKYADVHIVDNPEDHQKDKTKASSLNQRAMLIGAAGAVISTTILAIV
jgi:hypothetical protein